MEPDELPNLICPYCRDSLSDADFTVCAGCQTPHHATCFREHGRCTQRGCGVAWSSGRLAPAPRRPRATRRPGHPVLRAFASFGCGLVLCHLAIGANRPHRTAGLDLGTVELARERRAILAAAALEAGAEAEAGAGPVGP